MSPTLGIIGKTKEQSFIPQAARAEQTLLGRKDPAGRTHSGMNSVRILSYVTGILWGSLLSPSPEDVARELKFSVEHAQADSSDGPDRVSSCGEERP